MSRNLEQLPWAEFTWLHASQLKTSQRPDKEHKGTQVTTATALRRAVRMANPWNRSGTAHESVVKGTDLVMLLESAGLYTILAVIGYPTLFKIPGSKFECLKRTPDHTDLNLKRRAIQIVWTYKFKQFESAMHLCSTAHRRCPHSTVGSNLSLTIQDLHFLSCCKAIYDKIGNCSWSTLLFFLSKCPLSEILNFFLQNWRSRCKTLDDWGLMLKLHETMPSSITQPLCLEMTTTATILQPFCCWRANISVPDEVVVIAKNERSCTRHKLWSSITVNGWVTWNNAAWVDFYNICIEY